MSYHSNEYNNLMLPTESNIGMANNKYKNLFHSKSTSSKSSRASSRKKKNDVIALTNNTNNIALGGHTSLKKLRDVLKINPFHWDANFNTAFLLTTLEKPQFKKCLYHIHLCLDMQPLSWRCYHLMCIVYIGMGLVDKAHYVCKQGLSMHPGCGALHEQERTIHTLMEHRKLRNEIGQHGEGPLAQYNEIISEKMKLALLNVLNGIRHSSIDPRDPDSLGNIAHSLLNIDGNNKNNTDDNGETFYPPVVNLIKHYGPRKYECQTYYESTQFYREVEDIIKIGKRGIKAIQWRHILERNTKLKTWHERRKERLEFQEKKKQQKEREQKEREEKLRILGLTDERIDYEKKVDDDDDNNNNVNYNAEVESKWSQGNLDNIKHSTTTVIDRKKKKGNNKKVLKRKKSKSPTKNDEISNNNLVLHSNDDDNNNNYKNDNDNTNTDGKNDDDNNGEIAKKKESNDDDDEEEETCPEYPLPKYILFMDVDDTIFNTYNFMKKRRMNTIPIFDIEHIMNISPDVNIPMLKFYNWLIAKENINIIFVSERPFYAKAKLEIALRNSGFSQYYRLYCRDNMHQPSKCSARHFKNRTRKKVLKELQEKYGLKYRIFVIGK